jgi:hypothetical protein
MRSSIARFAMRGRGTVAAGLILVLATAGTAIAGSGLGADLELGVVNRIDGYLTTLRGAHTGTMFQVTNTGTGRGIGITVAAGKAPIVVGATAGKATNLDADKVDSYSANELSRGTRAKGASGTLTGSAATIASISLQAPRAGFVLVTAALEPYASTGCTTACQAGFALTDGSFTTWNYYQPVGAAPTGFTSYQGSTTITSMFAAAAGTKTVNIQAWQSGGTGTIAVFYDVTAVFVPFGGSGGGTLGAGSSSAASSAPGQ